MIDSKARKRICEQSQESGKNTGHGIVCSSCMRLLISLYFPTKMIYFGCIYRVSGIFFVSVPQMGRKCQRVALKQKREFSLDKKSFHEKFLIQNQFKTFFSYY